MPLRTDRACLQVGGSPSEIWGQPRCHVVARGGQRFWRGGWGRGSPQGFSLLLLLSGTPGKAQFWSTDGVSDFCIFPMKEKRVACGPPTPTSQTHLDAVLQTVTQYWFSLCRGQCASWAGPRMGHPPILLLPLSECLQSTHHVPGAVLADVPVLQGCSPSWGWAAVTQWLNHNRDPSGE